MSGEVTQTLFAGRDDGVPGNCVQAALASLLDRPIEAVPHFLLWLEWNHVMVEWLAEQGFTIRERYVSEIPDERCIVAGRSPRGVAHVCVAEAGEIVWDPHPSRDGLTRVTEAWFVEPKSVADPRPPSATPTAETVPPRGAGTSGPQNPAQSRGSGE